MTPPVEPSSAGPRAQRRTALLCLGLVLAMVGLAYASVPLYDLFCRATGYDGTPLVASGPADRVLEHRVGIRFDTNVAPGLAWSFAPEASRIEARVGETKTVFFRVRNTGSAPSTGIASFNVQPGVAGAYFVKIQCFCFSEQTLDPGQSMDFPVVFYVDPGIVDDDNVRNLTEITLSYTYFASKTGKPAVAASTAPGAPEPAKSSL